MEENATDSTIAATDCAIKQTRQSVVLGESARNCGPPSGRSNDWKPQKCAACATVATRSNATPTGASHFAAAVLLRMFTVLLPLPAAYSQTASISQVTRVTGRF